MSAFTVTLPSGEVWTPRFVQRIDEATCIGCGRCFKVCPQGVLELVGLDEDGERVMIDPDGDEDEEYEKKVMTIAHGGKCIGCTACSRICPKKCYTHAALGS
ncbi:ferredoxin III, nif-specific [Caldimonas tepidiphila]|uniref:ferredoxin III, nif-specific n=1 Tax=Caldimonas tepidiphila TaxID=2315841 RepID=UPI000E5A3133|nr:ferredoxin III, nif-specific [Caldimonas tepidiphila]